MVAGSEESRRYGRALARHLWGGGALQPVASAVPLHPGEECFGIAQGELLGWSGPPPAPGSWSPLDEGRVHITSTRIVFDGRGGRTAVPLAAFRSIAADGTTLQLQSDDGLVGIAVPYPHYWNVLLTRLATGAIVTPE